MPSRRQPCATAWVRPSVAPSLTSPRTVLWCRSATPRSWPRWREGALQEPRSRLGSSRLMWPGAACASRRRVGEVVVTRASLVRLVATDLDGTLLRSDGLCSGRTRAALAAVERAGIQVVLVTARPPRWLHDLADLVGEHGLALCGNGAFVYDVRSRQVRDEHCLAAADVLKIAADLRNALPGVVFAVESRLGYRRERDFLDEYTTLQDVSAATLEELLDPLPGKVLALARQRVEQLFERRSRNVLECRVLVQEVPFPPIAKAALNGKDHPWQCVSQVNGNLQDVCGR